MNKHEARKLGQQNRKQLAIEERKNKSHLIFEDVKQYLDKSNVVGCYVSMNEEVDTKEIIQYCFNNNISICVPKTVGNTLEFHMIHSFNELKEGNFHVLEPINNEIVYIHTIDCMIVPLSAYDSNNNRCGYGKGFYDSILKECKLSIGLAFQEQEIDNIEVEQHDVRLDMIIAR